LEFLESLKNEENKQSEAANEPADGLSHIERLENRIALVTGKELNRRVLYDLSLNCVYPHNKHS
jgi:2-C-methyl-D-erythritol 4-phosphate cytidylyltransferase